MFVDRVIEHFENQMMQTALIRVSDEHSRPFSDRLKTLQFVDLRGVVFLRCANPGRATATRFFNRNFFLNLRHKGGPWSPRQSAYREMAWKQLIISWFRTGYFRYMLNAVPSYS